MNTRVLNIHEYSVGGPFAWSLVATAVAATVALTLSAQAGFFVLVLIATAWWVWTHPEEGFLLLIIVAPILPMLKITQTIGTATLIKDVIIITLFCKLFVIPLVTQRLPYRRNALLAPIIVLALWSIIQTIRSNSIILGILRLRDILLYVLLYFVVLYLPVSKLYTRRIAIWSIAVFSIVVALGFYQWGLAQDSTVLRFDPSRSQWIPRISSILAHPSIFGQYAIALCTLIISIGLVHKRTPLRITMFFLLIASAIVLFLSYSRAVWIGAIIAFTSVIVMHGITVIREKHALRMHRRNIVIALVSLTAVVLIIMRITPASGLVRSMFDPTYRSNEERITFLTRLIAPLSTSDAIIGLGLGDVTKQNFRDVNLEVYAIASGASREVQLTKNMTLVDNQHIKTFIEMGVVGIVLYGWLYFRFATAAFHLIKTSHTTLIPDEMAHTDQQSKYTYRKVIGLTSFGFLLAFIIQGFFIDIWDIFPTNAIFWTIGAFASAYSTHNV